MFIFSILLPLDYFTKVKMKRTVLLFVIFGFSLKGFSQFELPKKTIKIAPAKNNSGQVSNTSIAPTIKYDSQFNKSIDDKLLKNFSLLSKKEEKSIMENEPLINPSEIYTDRMNKSQSDGKILEKYKSDTFLGEFKSGTKIIKIVCRDHEYPDGDLVRIWLNDKVAIDGILLDVEFREVYLELNQGINKIEIEALNQGESGPNTAQFVVFEENGTVITNNKWNLTTGVKAKIIVTKIDGLPK